MDAESEHQFREFVRTRSNTLLGLAYALTGQQQSAEDLLQNALAKTASRWRRVHTSPEAYVRTVMYHDQVSWWRRRRISEELTHTMPDMPDRADVARQSADRIALRDALRQLPPRQRAVLVLRFLEDRTEAETAQILGVTTGTVASQTHRALARLRARAAGDAVRAPDPMPSRVAPKEVVP
jgi:RNA polymerase sigma-70 factor (sigma-E family)